MTGSTNVICDNNLPDANERDQALDLSTSCIVQAPAGSGKTGLLIQRLLACLCTCNEPEEVLAITFTRAATSEMQARVIEALEFASSNPDINTLEAYELNTLKLAQRVLKRDSQYGWNLLKNPARLRIVTNDTYNASLTRQLPILSGLGGNTSICDTPKLAYREASISLLDEIEDESISADVRDAIAMLLRFASNRSETLITMMSDMLACRDQWLETVNEVDAMHCEQALEQFVNTRLKQVSGILPQGLKSALLGVYKKAPNCSAHDISMVNDVWPGADATYLNEWQSLLQPLFTKKGTLVKKFTKTTGFPVGEVNTKVANELLSEIHSNSAHQDLNMLFDVLTLPNPDYPQALDEMRHAISIVLTRLVGHLNVVFDAQGSIDFIENARRAQQALGGHDSVTDVLEKISYTVKHILIDEMQDTNYTQLRLVMQIIEDWVEDDGRTLFMVGDPMQSIYRFRQADVSIFQSLWSKKSVCNIKLTPIQLRANFRSSKTIVNWFNRVLSGAFGEADPYTCEVEFSQSVPVKSVDTEGAQVYKITANDTSVEANHMCDHIDELIKTYPDESIAVLARSRSHVGKLVEVLKDRGVTFSSQKIDALDKSKHVNDAMMLVRALRHPMDRIGWIGLLRSPLVGMSWNDCLCMSKGSIGLPIMYGAQHAASHGMSMDGLKRLSRLQAAIDSLDSDSRLANNLHARSSAAWHALGGMQINNEIECEDVFRFFDAVKDRQGAGIIADIEDIEQAIDGLYASPQPGVVQIMTIHEAKGLEFDTVLIPALSKRTRSDDARLFRHHLLPGGFVITPNPGKSAHENSPEKRLYTAMGKLDDLAARNESKRLLNVALTRAKKRMKLYAYVPDGTEAKPAAGSLINHIWDSVKDEVITLDSSKSSISDSVVSPTYVPTRSVPDADAHYETPAPGYIPKVDNVHLPSEQVVSSVDAISLGAGESYAREVGTYYHKIMEHIAQEKTVQAAQTGLVNLVNTLGALSKSLREAVQLVEDTLKSNVGKWMFDEHDCVYHEWGLSGVINGKWSSGIIDKMIVSGDTVSIIDYKTNNVSDESVHDVIEGYLTQMERYCALAAAMYPGKTIKSYLYFPRIDRLHQISDSHAVESVAAQ